MFTVYREPADWHAVTISENPVPGMLFGRSFGVGSQEVMQDMQQGPDMFGIIAALGFPDVAGDHAADRLRAAILVCEILCIGDRGHLRHVFMLGDG